jgi:hypothetical protein
MHIVQESNQNIVIYSPIVMIMAHILDVYQKNHFLLIMFSLFQAIHIYCTLLNQSFSMCKTYYSIHYQIHPFYFL